MNNRRDFLGGLVGVTAAAGTVAAAVASPDPDADLDRLIADWLAAHAAHQAACEAEDVATERFAAQCPPEPPPWPTWARANHPSGAFDPFGDRAVLTHPAIAAIDAYHAAAKATKPPGTDPELTRLQEALFAAGKTDAANYYAEIRPVYDRLVAENEAAADAIHEAEGLAALDDARAAAWAAADAAHEALLGYRPLTASGFLRKAAALLKSPFMPDSYDEDSGEVESLIADAEALIGGGAA